MSPYFQNRRGNHIYYEIINGEKPWIPLIFVHGYGSSLSMFAPQIQLLKPFFKLILFDAEGHGKSEKSAEELQKNLINSIVDDIENLLDLLEIRKSVAIIGHSLMGTGAAIEFSLRNPEQVAFLMLLNGGLLKLDSTIRNIFWNLLPQFSRMNFQELAVASLPNIVEKITPFIRAAISEEKIKKTSEPGDIDELIKTEINDLVDEQVDPIGISCPTLIIGAELDNFAPVYLSKELKKKIIDSELQIITMAGHFGPSQRYKAYNQAILSFLVKHNKIKEPTSASNDHYE